MRKLLLLICLLPVVGYAQTQIGSDIDGKSAEDRSGTSVSLSADGSIVAIGAPLNNGIGFSSGHVRVYENITGTWTQIGQDINGEANYDLSGNSVSLSADGSVVAIGAFLNDGNGTDAGHVRVYENIAGTWTQVGADIDGEAAGDQSGWSVSLSANGQVVAILAVGNSDNGPNAGHVRVYENIAGTWTQVGADIDGEAPYDQESGSYLISGRRISLSADGKMLAIAAPGNDGNGIDAGHVRVFENIAGSWTQLGADIDGEAMLNLSGSSVSLASDSAVVAIGAIRNNGNGFNSGHVRVYKYDAGNGIWSQVGADIDGEYADDQSGYSVSISGDGTLVAISAPNYSDTSSTDTVAFAGQVRVFENVAGSWTQIGTDIIGEAQNDLSGNSVSLSSDGTTVAVGARHNDGNGLSAGHVRVYGLSTGLLINNVINTDFIVYPSPASDFIMVQLNKGLQLEKINVYSTIGQLMKTEYNSLVSVDELVNGVYFIEVITNEGKVTKTIVVK